MRAQIGQMRVCEWKILVQLRMKPNKGITNGLKKHIFEEW